MPKKAKTKPEAIPNRDLDKLAEEIRSLEKRNLIQAVIWIGERLYRASKQCEEGCDHGEYQEWIKREFGWSYRTALRYRKVYEFERDHPDIFQRMNISLSALYYLTEIDGGEYDEEIRDAIIEAAKKGRVSLRIAEQIAQDTSAALRAAEQIEEQAAKSDTVSLLPVERVEPVIEPEAGLVPEEVSSSDPLIGALLLEHDDEDDPKEERWQRSLGNIAGTVIAMHAFWTREFGDWQKFDCPSDLVTLAKQAAQAMTELADDLSKGKKTGAVKAAADRAESKARRVH
jgi:hypothetical protein